jgi:hypothetical protein
MLDAERFPIWRAPEATERAATFASMVDMVDSRKWVDKSLRFEDVQKWWQQMAAGSFVMQILCVGLLQGLGFCDDDIIIRKTNHRRKSSAAAVVGASLVGRQHFQQWPRA